MQRNALTALARRYLWWLIVVLVGLCAVPAWADPKTEKAAQALQKKAVEEDSLNVDYAAAIQKLQTAISKCDGDKCNSSLKATLFRDLGAMQILGGNADAGKASFGQAVAMDPSTELDHAYKTPQLQAIWADVKKSGGAPASAGTSATPVAPVKAGPQPPAGDFVHTPPPEAPVRTPLPIYFEYSGSEDLAKVIVKYKGTGMSEWKSLELPTSDAGYGALIPCADVKAGLMRYYVQGYNDKNDPVAASGSKKQPFSVPVNATLIG
ncbi:MAG: hypothetical protein ACREJ3_06540, partial [Polyangiaceae bacterium]